jgi:hypothetical protein
MSALKTMFIEPAMSMRPSMGRPISEATVERAPSAAIRYRARMVYSWPVSRSRTRTSTPSSSWRCDRYSVEKRLCVPRSVAFLTRIGSR